MYSCWVCGLWQDRFCSYKVCIRKPWWSKCSLKFNCEKIDLCFSSVVVRFWPTPGSRHVSYLIRITWGRQQDLPVEHPLEAPLSSSRGHPPSEDSSTRRTPALRVSSEHHSVFSKSLLLLRTPPTRSRFFPLRARRTPLIHGVNYAARSAHILNIVTAPTPARMVTEGSWDHSPQSRALFEQLWRNSNMQIMRLSKSTRSALLIMTLKIFIHKDLDEEEDPIQSN